MIEVAIKLLTEIEAKGFEAYLVGGFVRDYLLGIKSNDVDITTNATPKDLKEIFKEACLTNALYGSVTIFYNSIHFEITTYRTETHYKDNRRPSKIRYVQDLTKDLMRRDFTVNAICMNKNKEIIDPLNGRSDLENKLIKTINKADIELQEDVLRILRAVRFATTLDFKLTEDVEKAIKLNKCLLKKLSYQRKKDELEKIFSSKHLLKGLNLLKKLELDKELELNNISKVKECSQVIGVWTVLEVDDIYPFARNEQNLMKSIREFLSKSPTDPFLLYKYGLYPAVVAGELKGVSKREINEVYRNLKIHKQSDLDITTEDILKVLKIKPSKILKEVYNQLIKEVLSGKTPNEKKALVKSCLKFTSMVV